MASSTYGMGQHRYSGQRSSYLSENISQPATLTSVAPTSGAQKWKDVTISLPSSENAFVVGSTYLLNLTIPQDENYDCNFNVKLINSIDELKTQTTGYQIIKYLHVPSAGNDTKNARVILYPYVIKGGIETPWSSQDGNQYFVKVAIAKDIVSFDNNFSSLSMGDIIYRLDGQNSRYYIWDPECIGDDGLIQYTKLMEIINKNDTILNYTWDQSKTITPKITYNIIFSPKTPGFRHIWLEMAREAIDWDIFNGDSVGRLVDIENLSCEVYRVKELLGQTGGIPKPLKNIGLYSHPNLIFTINGEEIRTGPSGYYELNDFEISSLGIVAQDSNDYFVLDYQYEVIN